MELEKAEGYSSQIYHLLLFLKRSSYLSNKLNFLLKDCSEEKKEKEIFMGKEEEEEFYDAQESKTEEAFKFYSSNERIVFISGMI